MVVVIPDASVEDGGDLAAPDPPHLENLKNSNLIWPQTIKFYIWFINHIHKQNLPQILGLISIQI